MKKNSILSIFLNVLFILFFGYLLVKKGGLEYIQTRLNIDNSKPDWYYKYFQDWKETKEMYQILPNGANEIIFLGSSLTYGCNWSELFQNNKIKNRGIRGDNTEGVLERLKEVTESKPEKIFIELGSNDIGLRMKTNEIIKNYELIIISIKNQTPKTKVYIYSVFPVQNQNDRTNQEVIELNKELAKLSEKHSITFINIYDRFVDEDKNQIENYFYDGLHLNSKGYLIWKECINQYLIEK